MSTFTSINKLREYPDNSEEYRTLEVVNHWNHSNRVELFINGKSQGIYIASELKRATDNAVNAHSH